MSSPPRPVRAARAAAWILLAACGSASGPADRAGPLVAEVRADALRLTNRGDRTIYTFVVDQESLPLIYWAPCADPVRCAGIAPGASRDLAYGTTAPERGRVAVVNWWYSRLTEAGYEPDSLTTFTLHL